MGRRSTSQSHSLRTVTVDSTEYPIAGVQVALFHEHDVFLQLRPFPLGWELPGGHLEPHEEPAIGAKREAEEETGCKIVIDGIVGVYSWQGLRSACDFVYCGHITSGTPKRSIETIRSRYFPTDTLPRTLFPWFQERIADAVAVERGTVTLPIHRTQHIGMGHVLAFGLVWLLRPLDLLLHRNTTSQYHT